MIFGTCIHCESQETSVKIHKAVDTGRNVSLTSHGSQEYCFANLLKDRKAIKPKTIMNKQRTSYYQVRVYHPEITLKLPDTKLTDNSWIKMTVTTHVWHFARLAKKAYIAAGYFSSKAKHNIAFNLLSQSVYATWQKNVEYVWLPGSHCHLKIATFRRIGHVHRQDCSGNKSRLSLGHIPTSNSVAALYAELEYSFRWISSAGLYRCHLQH